MEEVEEEEEGQSKVVYGSVLCSSGRKKLRGTGPVGSEEKKGKRERAVTKAAGRR